MWALILLPALASPVPAQNSREHHLKAVFLFNFAQFTEWPTNAFASADSPIVIGVLGDDPFGPILDETVQDEIVRGRQLAVQRYHRVEEIKTCHLLFISRSESKRIHKIVEFLKGKPVLTICDLEERAANGVMVQFVTEGGNVRFRINVDAVKAAALTLSSKLLRAAEIMATDKDR
jgi:hypothetical protein